jgi:hypothetical protein
VGGHTKRFWYAAQDSIALNMWLLRMFLECIVVAKLRMHTSILLEDKRIIGKASLQVNSVLAQLRNLTAKEW